MANQIISYKLCSILSWLPLDFIPFYKNSNSVMSIYKMGGCCGHDRMVVAFTTTCACAISAYHHESCDFEFHSWRDVLDATLFDKVCQ